MQTWDRATRSIKSEMCTYKLHFTPPFRLKAFPTCCPVVEAFGVTSNPWCDTIHLSPLQFAADFLSFIYGHLHRTADGRGQQTESLTYYLWFTILIPRELQSLRHGLFSSWYNNEILMRNRAGSSLRLWCRLVMSAATLLADSDVVD